jgi:ATP-dependent Clp protease adapter protein ClpS
MKMCPCIARMFNFNDFPKFSREFFKQIFVYNKKKTTYIMLFIHGFWLKGDCGCGC